MFYVRRTLPSGPIRFGVAKRRTEPLTDGSLSTGSRGEYVRKGSEGLYYSEVVPDELRELTGRQMRDDGGLRMKPLAIARILLGLTLLAFGVTIVFVRNDAIGYVEIMIGLALLIVPPARNWKRERERRQRERQERAARAAEETRRREMVGEFAARLQSLTDHHDAAALAAVRAERKNRDIPYEAVSSLAKRAVVDNGFESLSRIDKSDASAVTSRIDEIADAVGLSDEDLLASKREIYLRLMWHLLADDRMGQEQSRILESIRKSFALDEASLARERRAAEELEALSSLTTASLPSQSCTEILRFQEVCHHETRGKTVRAASRRRRQEGQWEEVSDCTLHVTSKRIIISSKSSIDVSLQRVFDLEIDIDEDILMISTDRGKKHYLRLADPIVSAGIIESAAARPRKPQGLA